MSDKKYFSYVRVSTQRQGHIGTSLAEQRAAIESFARNCNLLISKHFEERETAAKQGRPVFLEMLKQLRARRADGVIIHKIDRSARNLKDWADLGSLIDTGVEVHFASESLDLNSRGGRLSADIQAVVASDFIRNLREETKKGIYGRLKQGLFPFRAPVGYLDSGKGKPKAIDPVTGPLVRKAFELYSTGRWSLKTLPGEMHRRGLLGRSGKKLTVNGLFTVLHNPFYTGVVRIAKNGEVYAGAHRPLISKQLFDRAQEVFAGRNVPKLTIHNHMFRRMIRCGKCGNFLIAEVQKRKVYYRCHTRKCTPSCLKEETIIEALGAQLKRIELGPLELRYYRDEAKRLFGDWKDDSERLREELIGRHAKIKNRYTRLVDSYMDNILDKDDYLLRKAHLLTEERDVSEKLEAFGKNWDEIPFKFEEFLELANSAYLSVKSAPNELKRELVEVVTSNFVASGNSVSIKLENTFQLLAERPPFPSGSPCSDVARTISAWISKTLFELSRVGLGRPITKSTPLES